MDFRSVQQIAQNVIECSAALDGQLFTGKVTSANPLKIKISEDADGIELEGDDIILTANVVSKKLYIKKHKHEESEELNDTQGVTAAGPVTFIAAGVEIPTDPNTGLPDMEAIAEMGLGGPVLTLNHKHEIATSTLDVRVTEYGHELPRDPSIYDEGGEQVVITINRSLEIGDSVIMTRVSHGQQFVVLSRYFEVDKQGEDDDS